MTQKVILAKTGTVETMDDANVAESSLGRESKRLNLIREEPLKKWGERGFALPFFNDYCDSDKDDIMSFVGPKLSS